MTSDEFMEYWMPACVNLYGGNEYLLSFVPSCHGYRGSQEALERTFAIELKLDKDLGINEVRNYLTNSFHLDRPMTEELKNLLALLAGPNGKTLLRLYKIQRGLEK